MKQPRARLLVFNDPHAMRIDRHLAEEIGFEDSVVFLQLEYLIGISQHERDGKMWTFQSLRTLKKEQFPWWSTAKLMRIIKRLEELELITVGNFNKTDWDKTQWFSLNETGIARLKSAGLAADPFQNETPPVSKRNIDVSKMKHRLAQDETTIPKTTAETTNGGARQETAAADPAVVSWLKTRCGLDNGQATKAALARDYTWEELERLALWYQQKRVDPRIQTAGGLLWKNYAQYGELPDDLPPLPQPEEEPIFLDGQIHNRERYEREYGTNKHTYHR